MSNRSKRTQNLSSEEKRLLLEKLLKEKAQSPEVRKSSGRPRVKPIPQQSRDKEFYPLSFAQKRLWLLDQLVPGNPVYNIPVLLRLKGRLDVSALEQALSQILNRHEILRANFTTENDNPVQFLNTHYGLNLTQIDLEGYPVEDRFVEAEKLLEKHARQSFNLHTDFLVSATLTRLAADDHIFQVVIHHIISDGWSINLFVQELTTIYTTITQNKKVDIPPLPIQYLDFAMWEAEQFNDENIGDQVEYWKNQLEGTLPRLDMLQDRPRPAVQTFKGGQVLVDIPSSITRDINMLSRQQGATLFMSMLAVFKLLLAKHTDQEDIIVGAPIASRNYVEVKDLIGLFLNNLALRTDLSGDITFIQLLERVQQTTLNAFKNQDVPFEKLLKELRVERDPSRTPIFQVFFNMLDFRKGLKFELPELTVDVPAPSDVGSNFDITLYVYNWGDTLKLKLVYNTDLFYSEHMTELLKQYVQLLAQVTTDPSAKINDYSLVTSHAKSTLPDPTITLDEPEQVLLPQLITKWAEETPDQIAIEKDTQCWTYKELDEQATVLAQQLIRDGLQPREVVAVCGSRSFNLIASMLAIFKSGCVLLAIDDNLPNQRKQLMLHEASAKALIYIGDKRQEDIVWAGKLAPDNILILTESSSNPSVDKSAGDLASFSFPQLSGGDPAYIFFTSGTTGTPKGVQGNHKGLGHFLGWQRETFDIQPRDRAAQLTALSFDVVLRDIFIALVSGATLCLPQDDIHFDVERTLRWLQQTHISIVHTVPTLAQTWLANIPVGINLPELRWIFFAGEPLYDTLVHKWRASFSHGRIVNLYGPTETTLAKCFYQVPDDPPTGVQPVGYPIPQTQALVLNKRNQLCGIGEPGEIVLRTPFRTLGYINAPEENLRKFINNPFREDEQDKIYYTGDSGRFLPDGQLEILGRIDGQVKIRGIRIELGEIESALKQHPEVRQAVVSLWENEPGDKRLVAYIVPDPLEFPKPADLRGFLQKRIPEYMIPARFIMLDTVPLTPNGKINRKALPLPIFDSSQETTYSPPQTQLEELIAGVWADVLALEKVGIHDNFFELGGHSLLATQIMSRIRRLTSIELPLRVIFEFPTVASMTAEIELLEQKSTNDIPPLKPYERDKPPRLSFSQERMWFIHQLAPDSAAYNISSSVRIQGKLDTDIVEQAYNMIIERHEILRTTFDIVDGEPVQLVEPAKPITLSVIDLQSLKNTEQESQINRIITSATNEPFDLVYGPLIRAFFIKLDEYDHVLFTSMHHIVFDQWSAGIFAQEFTVIFNALSTKNQVIPLADLPVQYADYGLWQRDWLKGDVLKSKLAYWKNQLDGISILDLPTDFPRPSVQTYNGAYERLPLSASTIEAVRNLCRLEQITPFMFFLAIFKILLIRYTGQLDIAVGTPIANRDWFETEHLLGTFVNTVVLRTQLAENPTFKEFIHYIRDISLDAFAHQDFPFEKLIDELHVERDMSYSPLVQVLFNVQNAPATMPKLCNDPILTPIWPETGGAQFDITLTIYTDVLPQIVFTYNTDLLKKDTIARMLGHLEILANSALADPSQRVLEMPMLTQAERENQLVGWNDTSLDYPRSSCVHQLFEAQVEKTPGDIAVKFNDQQISYQELNTRANQLAHYLQELGVTAETPVGISMDRSAEMVIGLLGILKAGGTYIPLDPLFPRDRLDYMLENSQASVLLTQERLRSEIWSGKIRQNNLLIINLDSEWQSISQYSGEDSPISTEPNDLAYLIYTSGSTGKPKGVQIPHRAVVNFLASMQQMPGLTADDRLLSVTTLSFDISVLEIFLPLITGACVTVVPGEAVYDGTALIKELSTNDITIMQATPATWQMLIDAGWQGDKNLKVLCGGEAMPKDLAKWLTEHVGSVWNMYGPTETTVWSTICEITPETKVITIGRPIANTQIYILDKNLEPTPIGVVGDLYIAGDGVARGYLKQPELTADKFLPDPFSNKVGVYMYKTGDQARYLADGQIDFLGRVDFQVKVRGFRIELGEIETVLNKHSDIHQAVVIVREDAPGDKRLIAYLIPEANCHPDAGELRQYIRTKLPEYMVPSSYVALDEFPMTPNRKVNRKALPAPDESVMKTEKDFVLPRNSTEEKIAEIWTTILGVPKIDIHDNFFDLGGHSLLATRVISHIREQFQIDLPLRTLFMTPTIAQISEAVDTILWATTKHSTTQNMIAGNKDGMEI